MTYILIDQDFADLFIAQYYKLLDFTISEEAFIWFQVYGIYEVIIAIGFLFRDAKTGDVESSFDKIDFAKVSNFLLEKTGADFIPIITQLKNQVQ